MKVGVVGAGVAGLTAAYELGKLGHRVTLYERSPFYGGQASTFELNGARLERGYHHLFTGDVYILNLIREIGLGNRLRYIDSTVGTFCNGRIYDFVTASDLLKFSPLSFLDRIRLGLVALRLRRMQDWSQLENITAEEWILQNAGTEVYSRFWEPMLRGKFGDDYYQQVGMAWVWGKMHTRFASRKGIFGREKLVYPIGSFGEIFDVLADKILGQGGEIHVSLSVDAIESGANNELTGLRFSPSPASWTSPEPLKSSRTEDSPEKGSITRSMEIRAQFDAVISTVSSSAFAKMVPHLPANYKSKLTGVNYLSAVLVILVLDRPLSDVYWLNVADHSIPFVGVIEQTNLIKSGHYGGKHIVYLSNYVGTNNRLYKLKKDELLSEYLPHLKKINPLFQTSWIQDSYYHKVDAAQPIVGVNYSESIPSHRTPIRGLYLANTTQVYPEDRGTNYSVRMGKFVAQMLHQDFE